MAIDERSRHELYRRLEETLGPEAATTLMEHLPPVGWADVATKRDLEHSAALTKRDLDQLEQRFSLRLEGLEDRSLRAMSDLRAELFRAMSAQTRMLVLTVLGATLGAVFAVAGLS